MESTWEVFIVLFPAFFLCIFVLQIVSKIKKDGRPSWFAVAMWLLMLVGCTGFFAAFLAADGILRFPNTFRGRQVM
jgi:predicted PurR-regulated permease PerM